MVHNFIDITGQKFGRLTVIKREENGPLRRPRWHCVCDCGGTTLSMSLVLRNGKTKSCGCYNKDKRTSHGMSKTRIYKIWKTMKSRCENKNDPAYHYYGQRGISVCDRWQTFENFYADMGDRPDGKTLDRVNNSKGYSPDNVAWKTRQDQMNNTRKNVNLTHNGETLTAAQWADRIGICRTTFYNRIYAGWRIERILTTPVRHRRSPT